MGADYPVLMYGPTVRYSVVDWLRKLKIIPERRAWVEAFVESKHYKGPSSKDTLTEKDIKIIFAENFEEYGEPATRLMEYLDKHGLKCAMHMSWDRENPYIGACVKDYASFDEETKQKVHVFCTTHSLGAPTFYAGIQ